MKKFFHYINSVYKVREKINMVRDKRKRVGIPAAKTLSTVLISLVLQYKSFNEIFTYETSKKRIKHYVKGRLPKIDAAREVLRLAEKADILAMHDSIVKKIYENKTFRAGTIEGHKVVAIDGVELFSSTKKSCDECLKRKHSNGTTAYFHRSVVCMTVGRDPHIILGQEMLNPRDGNEKDEGEQTGAKRLVERLARTHHHFADIIVSDALYVNAPYINLVLSKGMDVVIRMKDKNRLILKDALPLFQKGEGRKADFKKNGVKVEVWDLEGFEMEGVGVPLRVLQFKEKHLKEKEERIVWVITTSKVSHEIIWLIMHKRWDIEENGFHQLKTYYHAKHCFAHKAIENIFVLNIMAFNLREMYLFKRIRGFRKSKMTRREVTITLRDDLLVNDYRNFYDTG